MSRNRIYSNRIGADKIERGTNAPCRLTDRKLARNQVWAGPLWITPVLVGPNNCGKATVIEALALLFGRDRMVRTLTEYDFFGGNPQPTDRIRLIATVTGFHGK